MQNEECCDPLDHPAHEIRLLKRQRLVLPTFALPIAKPLLQHWIAPQFVLPDPLRNIAQIDFLVEKKIARLAPLVRRRLALLVRASSPPSLRCSKIRIRDHEIAGADRAPADLPDGTQ